ncbi:MAG: hypothetical protein GF416_09170 [Candidatus Altiarchaeales archaeon]|nr:hypothetical protein [Candidatus Altiarchaeales archaeon]
MKDKRARAGDLDVRSPETVLDPARQPDILQPGDKRVGPRMLDSTVEAVKGSGSTQIVHSEDRMFSEGRLFSASAVGEPQVISNSMYRVDGGNGEMGTLVDSGGGKVQFYGTLGGEGNITAFQIRDGRVSRVENAGSVNVRDPLFQGLVVATAGDAIRVVGDYVDQRMPVDGLAGQIVRHHGGSAAVYVPEGDRKQGKTPVNEVKPDKPELERMRVPEPPPIERRL